jgi:hypothetical protein
MSETQSDIRWYAETQTLSGWTQYNGRRVQFHVPRALIHSIPIYNDAVEWEIERNKDDILERLKPILSAKGIL